MAWTSNNPSRAGYQSLNTWGDHYWMVEFEMDCSDTENGWFEVKSFLLNGQGQGWEGDVHQAECQGTTGGKAPFATINHWARCGFVNKFDFQGNGCEINYFPTTETPSPETTTAPSPIGDRTVVFVKMITNPIQDLFLRGGLDSILRPNCSSGVPSSCTIPIKDNSLGETEHYAKYNAWREGDTALDWNGAEKNQGTYQNRPAEGTPMAWTSNNPSRPGYQSLNTWGDHYWMVDFNMDCSQTEQGWFEFKSVLYNGQGWENDIHQIECEGSFNGNAPFKSNNHMAKCGFINKFDFGANSCENNYFQSS